MFANTPPDPDLVQPTIVVRGVRQQSQWEMDLIRGSLQLNFAADQFQFVNGRGGGGAGSTTNTYPWATAEDILEMAQIVVESPPTWTGSNTYTFELRSSFFRDYDWDGTRDTVQPRQHDRARSR